MTLELESRKSSFEQETPKLVSKWSNRFIWAAIIQGLAATLITIPIVAPWIKPAVSMVMAGGSAGTWFTVGYLSYITVGVIAVAVTALFYQHFEVSLGKPYGGASNYLAWIHLIFMNVGVAAAAGLLMYGVTSAARLCFPWQRGASVRRPDGCT